MENSTTLMKTHEKIFLPKDRSMIFNLINITLTLINRVKFAIVVDSPNKLKKFPYVNRSKNFQL